MAQKKQELVVTKSNVLNDIIAREFAVQELRLFSLYLARINPMDVKTRILKLPLHEFYRIMDLNRVNAAYLKKVTGNLLKKVVCFAIPKGGYEQFQLFKECKVYRDPCDLDYYFEIDAHDKAIIYMFEYKRAFFKYKLWNVLKLESVNQFRMYEILKQFEFSGERIIYVDKLRELLGIEAKEYPQYRDFNKFVLKVCQKALKEKTDISFTYEPCARATGRGGKITALRFTITENKDYHSQINIAELIDEPDRHLAMLREMDSVDTIDFITEDVSFLDRLSILQVADGDATLVQTAYEMSKQNASSINNLTAWLIAMITKLKKGTVSQPVKLLKQSKFVNFEQTNQYDFDKLEKKEQDLYTLE